MSHSLAAKMKLHFFVFPYFLASIVAIPKGLDGLLFYQLFFLHLEIWLEYISFSIRFKRKKGH